jgi:hypothetical protein
VLLVPCNKEGLGSVEPPLPMLPAKGPLLAAAPVPGDTRPALNSPLAPAGLLVAALCPLTCGAGRDGIERTKLGSLLVPPG